jgi:glutaredoxin
MLAIAFEFVDEEEALAFADEHPEHVVGVYKVPTIFCETVHGGTKTAQQGFTQGQRWGWWVCGYCKKPKKTAYAHKWEYLSNFGWNLLTRFIQEGKLVAFPKRDDV